MCIHICKHTHTHTHLEKKRSAKMSSFATAARAPPLASSSAFVARSGKVSSKIQKCRNRNVVTRMRSKDDVNERDLIVFSSSSSDIDSNNSNSNNNVLLQAFSVAPFLVFSPKAFAAGAFDSVSNAFSSPEFHELSMYTMKTLISWGVPAVTVGIVALMIISGARRGKSSSGGSEDGSSSSPFGFLKGGQMGKKPRTQPYLSIKRLNDRLDSYALQFEAATVSKTSAKRQQNKQKFEKRYADALGKLSSEERNAILEAQKKWKEVDDRLKMQMNAITASSRKTALELGAKKKDSSSSGSSSSSDEKNEGASSSKEDGDIMNNIKNKFGMGKENPSKQAKELGRIASERMLNEDKYLTAVAAAIPKSKLKSLEDVLKDPNQTFGWQANSDVLLLNNVDEVSGPKDKLSKKHVFVLDFFGDVQASQAAQLREEVTGLLRSAKKERGDEVILRLNTGGGTVTGYGLAAAQLTRIKAAGLPLTICVEQVAASGGYMMACVADKIVASPFAVLGSIGVISDVPNVYERLKNEGIEFATITAGKYKRTITPTKKITKEDLIKTTKDIEDVLTLFKGFVSTNRPSLNIDEVATGETWFGPDAMKRGLCDELKTSDDVLLDLVSSCEIFSVKLKTPPRSPLAFAGVGASNNAFSSWGLLAALASAVAKYAQTNGGAAAAGFLPPNANPATSSTGMGFQAIDREADNFMMLDQSYGNMNAGMMDFDFDDDMEVEDFEF